MLLKEYRITLLNRLLENVSSLCGKLIIVFKFWLNYNSFRNKMRMNIILNKFYINTSISFLMLLNMT